MKTIILKAKGQKMVFYGNIKEEGRNFRQLVSYYIRQGIAFKVKFNN